MPRDPVSNLPNQLTIRFDDPLAAALAFKAAAAGQDPVDFVTDLVTRTVRDAMQDKEAARRVDARLALKAKVVALARRLSPPEAFDPDVTLKVFQAIRNDPELLGLYTTAAGGDITLRGQNTAKAILNRELGGLVKSAVGAEIQVVEGTQSPVKVQLSSADKKELMFSYTRLQRAGSTA
jgi:hypothetical protein